MLLWTWVLGCTSGPSPTPFDDDVRVDAADDSLGVDSHSTRMCVTPSGSIFVFWVDARRGPNLADLWMTRSDDLGRTWFDVPFRVNTGNGRVSDPTVVCSERGVVAAWTDDRASDILNGNIYLNVLEGDGDFFDEDRPVDDDPAGLANSQDVVVAVDGDFIGLAWADNRYGAYDILFARSTDFGASVAPPLRLGADMLGESFSGKPAIAALGDGDVWVAWEDTRDGGVDIYLQGSTTGGTTFQAPLETRLDRGDTPGEYASRNPRVCPTAIGAAVVWHDGRNGKGDDILVASSADGRQWSEEPVSLDSDNPGFSNSDSPRCVSEGSVVHTVWVDERSGGADLYYRAMDGGVPLEDVDERVDRGLGPGAAVADTPAIALGVDGPVVAWLDDRLAIQNGRSQAYNNVYYNFVGEDGAWQDEDFRADAGPNGLATRSDLNLAVVGRTAVLAWTDERDGTQDVYVRVLELGEGIEGPDE